MRKMRHRLPRLRRHVCQLDVLHDNSFGLCGLLCGLGHLTTGCKLLVHSLDDADRHGLPHVTHSKTTKGRVLGKALHTHELSWHHDDDSSITGLKGLGVVLKLLAGTTVDLLLELAELAGNVSSMAIEHRGVTLGDLTRVVQDDDLGSEVVSLHGRVVLAVASHVTTTDFLDGDVLDVEANVVAGGGLNQGLVVHLHGLDLSGHIGRGKGDDHTGLQDASLHTAHGYCSNTANLVDVLQGQTEGLLSGAAGWQNGIQSLKQGGSAGIAFLALNLPALEPSHLVTGLQHVVSMPARDWHKGHGGGVVADLLDVGAHFLGDLLKTLLAVRGLSGVHLVDSNDELLDSQGEGQQGVLAGLTVL